jgi:hypothetical protein
MTALDPGEIRRLTACLSRLASPHDGEIIAAAKAAERILDKMGLRFGDLTIAAALPPPEPRPRHTRRERCRPTRQAHQQRAYILLHCGFAWSDWEREFLYSINGWATKLSEKQATRLRELEIAAAAWSAGRRAA